MKVNKGRYIINHGLSRQLQTIKTYADSPDSFRLSKQLQIVADCQGNCRQFQNNADILPKNKILAVCEQNHGKKKTFFSYYQGTLIVKIMTTNCQKQNKLTVGLTQRESRVKVITKHIQ